MIKLITYITKGAPFFQEAYYQEYMVNHAFYREI